VGNPLSSVSKTSLVAKALILDSEGSLLLLTRSATHPALAHYCDLPGGIVEPGEEPGEGVKREVLEETGLVVEQAIPVYAVPVYSSGHNYPTLLYVVRLNSAKPDITLSWEHEAYEWVSLEHLCDVEPQLASVYPDALRYIQSNEVLEDL
jgi:8-oxo-dGTP pyrophosphatase MutT (NUDIX family)